MTKFGIQNHNVHLLKSGASKQSEDENSLENKLQNISIKPIILRKPNQLKPLKMLHEIQQETIKLYDINRIQKQYDVLTKSQPTKNLINDVNESSCVPSFLTHINDIKTADDDSKAIFGKFESLRQQSKLKLSELTQRINGIPYTLIRIYKNKQYAKLLCETFVRCRRVIVLDVAQIEFTLRLLPVEVNERICQLLGDFFEQTQQRLNECIEVNMENLKRLYQLRAYLHQVFESIFVVISVIAQESSSPEKVSKPEKIPEPPTSIVKSEENKQLPTEESETTPTNEVVVKGEEYTQLDVLLYPKLMDYNFSYQFNRDILKQMLDKLTDEQSKQSFISENGGKSRQILNREIVVEINRLGGFDLHLKTIQPILKRLFPKPEELDPESRSLNLAQNWGAFQYYCENLIDAVKKLFYTSIPDRDIVTPVLSHYVASLAICNPYFRIYVQHFILDISEFHLFDLESNDCKILLIFHIFIHYIARTSTEIDTLKLDRLDNIYHFMAYLYLTPSGVGLSEKIQLTCFGLRNAWYVLAKVANSKSPYVELKVIVVYRFLQTCGFAMMVFYQNQFVKLLNYIIVHCMMEWKKNLPSRAYPFFIRLYDLINNACVTGVFKRPKYLNKKIFPYLNRVNIPKFNDRELFCIRNFRLLYD